MEYTVKKTSKWTIAIAYEGEDIEAVKARVGCPVIMNGHWWSGGGFSVGDSRVNGVTLSDEDWALMGFAWNSDDAEPTVLHSSEMSSYDNFISTIPLRFNDKDEKIYLKPSGTGVARETWRTCFGRLKSGAWVFRTLWGDPWEAQRQMQDCEHAMLLDGGGSTCMITPEGKQFSTDGRFIYNYLCVWPEGGGQSKVSEEVPSAQYSVCLDAGHGGEDTSNQSPDGRYKEHEFNLDLAQRTRDLLIDAGIEVVMTRDADITVGLNERAQIANTAGADAFVSIHTNAISGGWREPRGLCVYTYAEGGNRDVLAVDIIDAAEKAEVLLFGAELYHAGFTVLANTNMPAVLVECGFHTNREDVALLETSEYRDKLAKVLAEGVCAYFDIPLEGGEAEENIPDWGKEAWEKITEQGIIQSSDFYDTVTFGELAVILDRMGLL